MKLEPEGKETGRRREERRVYKYGSNEVEQQVSQEDCSMKLELRGGKERRGVWGFKDWENCKTCTASKCFILN